ncbi:MAG: HD domain-containing protein, partial [Thermoguttaceae bacterium]
MPAGPHFRTSLIAARQRLTEGRGKLADQHARGAAGVQVCAGLTVLLDDVVGKLFETALEDLGEEGPHSLRKHLSLVPLGGYGRRTVAPYSDVDLMILHTGDIDERVAALAKRLTQDIYDVGLDLGHSVRTPAEACLLARGDITICTSLLESRLLVGSASLFEQFQTRFAKMTERRFESLQEAFVMARRDERAKFGETVYLLEPNVKRSHGGLRDVHLLRWMGYLKFGETGREQLRRRGALSTEDVRCLRNADEFLLRLRNEMHFHAGMAHDVLDRAEQMRLAELFGYRSGRGLLPVERFMREYFRHAAQVRNVVSRFAESVRPTTAVAQVLSPIFNRTLDGNFRLGREEISVTAQGLDKLKGELSEVLRLADMASLHDRRIARSTWVAVYRAGPQYSDDVSEEVATRFLSLLTQTARVGELLRELHELGVLEKVIPAFARARCLLQFNVYHKYTVDEHCIRAVQRATEFISDEGPLGNAYRQIKQRGMLHLALLLHDLGKGSEEDHIEVGLRIAAEVTQRLRLEERQAELVKFLVHKHLLMS